MGPPRIAQDAIAMAEHATHTQTTRASRARSIESGHTRETPHRPREEVRNGAPHLRGHGQRERRERVTRDACVRDGDLGGARGSSQLIISVNPPRGIL